MPAPYTVGTAKPWFYRVTLTRYDNPSTKLLAPEADADTHPDLPRGAFPYGDQAFMVEGMRGCFIEAHSIIHAFHRDDPRGACNLPLAYLLERQASARVMLSNGGGDTVIRGSYGVGEDTFYEYLLYITRNPVAPGEDAQADVKPPRSFRVSTTR